MKTLMDCDSCFDALTAGPVDGDSATAELQLHLQQCASCRELSEALRPAIHLIHESLPPAEQASLPQFLASTDRAVAQVMGQIPRVESPARGSWRHRTSLLCLATSAVLLVGLLGPWWSEGHGAPQTFPEELEQLGLPQACLGTGATESVHDAASCQRCHETAQRTPDALCTVTLPCCTTCHQAPKAAASTVPVGRLEMPKLVAACHVCHDVTKR